MPHLALDLRLRLGRFVLEVAEDIELAPVTALFGASGSGKTTLLRIIAGLERAAIGTVRFDADTWQSAEHFVPAHRRGAGVVFQHARLFTHLTVAGNLDFAARRAPPARPGPDRDEVVETFDLGPLLDRPPATLSGGERQRVALARTLLARPRLLLMDEPLAALDVDRRGELIPAIEAVPRRFGVPVLYVTHAVDEVLRLAPRMLLVAGGRVVAAGSTAALLERLDLAPLTGAAETGVMLNGQVAGHDRRFALTRVTAAGQLLEVPGLAGRPGDPVRLRIRARDVAVATAAPAGLSIRNALVARIVSVDTGGDGAYAEVRLDVAGAALLARITRASAADLGLEPGMEVWALVKSVALDGLPGAGPAGRDTIR